MQSQSREPSLLLRTTKEPRTISIGVLSKELNRTPQTLRRWVKDHWPLSSNGSGMLTVEEADYLRLKSSNAQRRHRRNGGGSSLYARPEPIVFVDDVTSEPVASPQAIKCSEFSLTVNVSLMQQGAAEMFGLSVREYVQNLIDGDLDRWRNAFGEGASGE